MSDRAGRSADPLEAVIEAALDPGGFVSDRACFDFVADLEEVERQIADLVTTAPPRAAALYEAFVAGCYAKAEEVDDSSGCYAMFVTDLFCGWIRARQAGGAAADETAARLLAWMDDDPYSLSYEIERDVVRVLDRAGLAALVEMVRDRLEQAPAAVAGASEAAGLGYESRRWAAVLRTLYAAQRAVGAYVELAEATGLTRRDCHEIAKMLSARRKPEEALAWVERGLGLEAHPRGGSAADRRDLVELKGRLLTRLGREGEALELAWSEYEAHPGSYAYDELMKFVPEGQHRAWHDRAIEAAAGGDLHAHIRLLLHTQETERLVELVRRSTDGTLEGVSHLITEEAAEVLERVDPEAAARLWRVQGMRILATAKSRHYSAALRSFERARGCYDEAGLASEWEQVVADVRASHHRKSSFMPRFEEIVSGSRPDEEPSFLERAKQRWAAPS